MFPPYHGILFGPSEALAASLNHFFTLGASAGRDGDGAQWTTAEHVPTATQYINQRETVQAETTWTGPKFNGLESYSYPEIDDPDMDVATLEAWADAMTADFNSQAFIDETPIRWATTADYPGSGGVQEQAYLEIQYVPQKTVLTSKKRYNSVADCVNDNRTDSFFVAPGYFKVLSVYRDDTIGLGGVISYEGQSIVSPNFYESFSRRNFLGLPRYLYQVEYPGAPVSSGYKVLAKAFDGEYVSQVLEDIAPEPWPTWAHFVGPASNPGNFDDASGYPNTTTPVLVEEGGYQLAQDIDTELASFAYGSSFTFSKIEEENLTKHEVTFECVEGAFDGSSSMDPYVTNSFYDTLTAYVAAEPEFSSASLNSVNAWVTAFECTNYTRTNEGGTGTGVDYSYDVGDVESDISERNPSYQDVVEGENRSTDQLDYAVLVPARVYLYVILPGTPQNIENQMVDTINEVPFDYNY